jgi:transposase
MTKDIFFKTEILEQYLTGKVTATKVAKMLNVSERQFWRIIKKYRENGKIGLLHNLCRRPSNHSLNKELKEKVLKLAEEKYFNFNPTLMGECLKEEEGITINPFTLRLWLKENKLINKLRKRKPYRTK